jgi:ssDNA-binding Zn-finger/Zn-ribbon topoisomerase 1
MKYRPYGLNPQVRVTCPKCGKRVLFSKKKRTLHKHICNGLWVTWTVAEKE